eukprot:TRINITY_DN4579_c0_g1_i1.p1 TRINITY_DN4579_c0_g1~~TRINITY_DN4579_c0_g1_i1.p1  ORF type:complete len:311 (+),score=57.12 TRINITY_DN4579_c0_g1_i1:61-993(+)
MQDSSSIVERLNMALDLAKSAVDADMQKDYTQAVRKYTDTVAAIDAIKDRITTPSARANLVEKCQRYQKRIEILEKATVRTQSKNTRRPSAGRPSTPGPSFRPTPTTPTTSTPSTPKPAASPIPSSPTTAPSMPTFPPTSVAPPPIGHNSTTTGPTLNNKSPGSLFFIEETIGTATMPDRPDSANRRTLWLVSLLHQTMTTGGFLSPKLYVSNSVWMQSGAKFSAVQQKVTGLNSVLEGLTKLLAVDITNTEEAAKQLEEFYGITHGVQVLLAKHLSFVKEPKDAEKKGLFKNIGTGMSRLQVKLSAASS